MGAVMEKILARMGKTAEEVSKTTRLGKIFKSYGVQNSHELNRILALPQRDLDLESTSVTELVDLITNEYKTRLGTWRLKPIQAAALAELHDYGGLVGPVPVGQGKTIISLLAASVVESKRPLLVVPAKLVRKTKKEAAELQAHFRFPLPEIISYEKISRKTYKHFLAEYRPDLIICDETHKLKQRKSAVTLAFAAYFKMSHDPDADRSIIPFCRFVGLSGTLTSRSLKDYAHLCDWALGAGSPLPRTWPQLVEWAAAIDEKVQATERMSPGALMKLCSAEEITAPEGKLSKFQLDPLQTTREAYSRRFLSTPGVISVQTSDVSCSLLVTAVEIELPAHMDEKFVALRDKMETADGYTFSFKPQLWAHARNYANGFFYVWTPRPPQEWVDARRNWTQYCSEFEGHTHNGELFRSPFDVATGIEQGRIPDPDGYLLAWQEIRPSFKPNVQPVWIDDTAINYAKDWAKKNKGIIWVEQGAFGERLAEETGFRFFRRQGRDQYGLIDDTSEEKDGCIIASVKGCGEGVNLQKGWQLNLMTTAVTTNTQLEQLLGRCHRFGHRGDEVEYQIMTACYEDWAGLDQAIRDAKYQQGTMQTPQKILIADITRMTEMEVAQKALKEARWRQKGA